MQIAINNQVALISLGHGFSFAHWVRGERNWKSVIEAKLVRGAAVGSPSAIQTVASSLNSSPQFGVEISHGRCRLSGMNPRASAFAAIRRDKPSLVAR